MIYNCPKQLIEETNRRLFLLFDFCKTDEEIAAHRRAQKSVTELKELLDKSCNLRACRAEKKICDKSF